MFGKEREVQRVSNTKKRSKESDKEKTWFYNVCKFLIREMARKRQMKDMIFEHVSSLSVMARSRTCSLGGSARVS